MFIFKFLNLNLYSGVVIVIRSFSIDISLFIKAVTYFKVISYCLSIFQIYFIINITYFWQVHFYRFFSIFSCFFYFIFWISFTSVINSIIFLYLVIDQKITLHTMSYGFKILKNFKFCSSYINLICIFSRNQLFVHYSKFHNSFILVCLSKQHECLWYFYQSRIKVASFSFDSMLST